MAAMIKFHLHAGKIPMCTMTAVDQADAEASFRRHYPGLAWDKPGEVRITTADVEFLPSLGNLLSLRKR